ncbi:hypothetical protein Pyn_23756 [Prunus yedoensis var. nudiflora]|uniref:Uncharacterized protein n=1 Tax=Prunus yedoensis var. nudiflora TaxID=2094558 RepID=A0A314Z2U3_PRUYE|nr:hypothetical protein Pyn_23756 [Prunus yedoensis var. nudiflora]
MATGLDFCQTSQIRDSSPSKSQPQKPNNRYLSMTMMLSMRSFTTAARQHPKSTRFPRLLHARLHPESRPDGRLPHARGSCNSSRWRTRMRSRNFSDRAF